MVSVAALVRCPMRLLVPDTNVYLHGKHFETIAWDVELNGGQEVCIVVPYPVVRELDKAKYSGPTAGIRSRAEKVISRLLSLVEKVDDVPVRLRHGVALRVMTKQARLDPADDLDPDDGDDRLLADVLALQRANEDVLLCTRDGGLLLKARGRGLPHVRFPQGLWEEVDDSVARELAALKNARPKLEVALGARGQEVAPSDALLYEIVSQPLQEQLELLACRYHNDLVARHGAALVRREDSWLGRGRSHLYEDDIRQEQDRMNKQVLEYRRTLSSFCSARRERGLSVPFRLLLDNKGRKPAKGIRVFVTAKAPLALSVSGAPLKVPTGLGGRLQNSDLPIKRRESSRPQPGSGVSMPSMVGSSHVWSVPKLDHELYVELPGLELRVPQGFDRLGGTISVTYQCEELLQETKDLNFKLASMEVGPFDLIQDG